MRFRAGIGTILAVVGIALAAFRADAETFRIATYNVENYLDAPAQRRHVKSAESRAKVVESIDGELIVRSGCPEEAGWRSIDRSCEACKIAFQESAFG